MRAAAVIDYKLLAETCREPERQYRAVKSTPPPGAAVTMRTGLLG